MKEKEEEEDTKQEIKTMMHAWEDATDGRVSQRASEGGRRASGRLLKGPHIPRLLDIL